MRSETGDLLTDSWKQTWLHVYRCCFILLTVSEKMRFRTSSGLVWVLVPSEGVSLYISVFTSLSFLSRNIWSSSLIKFSLKSVSWFAPKGHKVEPVSCWISCQAWAHLPSCSCFPGVRERSQEQCLRETCEAALLLALHPRSSLTLVLQVLHDDGSVSFSKPNVWTREGAWPDTCRVVFLTCCAAPVLLPERRLHGPHGRRSADELPLLWRDLCHQRRRTDHHRPHRSSGKGQPQTLILAGMPDNPLH